MKPFVFVVFVVLLTAGSSYGQPPKIATWHLSSWTVMRAAGYCRPHDE